MSWKKIAVIILFWFFTFIAIWLWILQYFLSWWDEDLSNKSADISSAMNEEDNESIAEQPVQQYTWNKSFDEISIHMPSKFNNNWFRIIKRNLEKNLSWDLNLVLYDNKYEYKDSLFSTWYKDMDIFIVNSLWLDSFVDNTYSFELADSSIKSLFNSIFYDILDDDNYSYIPYLIDPFVTFTNKNSYWNNISELEFQDIKRYVLLNSWWNTTINIWLWQNDIIANRRGVNLDYYWSLLNMIFSWFFETDNEDFIEFLIDIWTDDIYKWWDMQQTYSLYNNLDCKTDSCLFKKWHNDLMFWNSSSLANFWDFDDYNIFNNPFFTSDYYPVQTWWFMINENVESEILALEFVQEFIDLWASWNRFFYDNYMFSAFNNIFYDQSFDWDYSWIKSYQWRYKTVISEHDMYKDILSSRELLQFIRWNMSFNSFIESL